MKTLCKLLLGFALLLAASPCYALWDILPVDKEQAKENGIEVRGRVEGKEDIRIEIEFRTDGRLKEFSDVELRFGDGDKPLATAPLRVDRTKEGRATVSFHADRARLDQISVWIRVPEVLGGTIYEVRPKEFVEVKDK